MTHKQNFKFLPIEIEGLTAVASRLEINRNRLIRRCITDANTRGRVQQLLQAETTGPVTKTVSPINRIPISLRLTTAELRALRGFRRRGNTTTETLRSLLGLRHISSWFVNAARASSGPRQRVVSIEAVARYFRIVRFSEEINRT